MIIIYKAHINTNDNSVQSVLEHSVNTAEICRESSVDELKEIMYAMGALHDIGKYQPSFQKRIDGQSITVEHSVCGAKEAERLLGGAAGLLMEYCISGHHSGIPDGGSPFDDAQMPTLYGRMKRETEDYSYYKKEIKLPEINTDEFGKLILKDCKTKKELVEKFAFITRYCFSCLTDADSTDTAEFCSGIKNTELKTDFKQCLDKINSKLNSYDCVTELQKSRSRLQQQVYDKADSDSEIYLMNMPTGSGKTLCSMKFALERAIRTGKKRIIYVIPYNSIIDQTVKDFEDIFGESASILRHQSSFSYDDSDYDEDYKKQLKSSAENWNAQLIVTTAVQFFESVYANKRSKLRKMHNIADSILVFDEAHLMPAEQLQPCLRAIVYATRLLNSEAVFLTATMPDFDSLIRQYAFKDSKITELISDKSLFENFRKCSFKKLGTVGQAELIEHSMKNPSSLIVVNKRKTARELFSLCSGEVYHLSTYMTALDRKNTIEAIKKSLKKLENDYPDLSDVPLQRRITVISTSLIEAGVDLDFHCVYREVSGLDSILQAGGRCNREGKRADANVYVFDFGEKNVKDNIKEILTKRILQTYDDISCENSVTDYYQSFYEYLNEAIEKNTISADCEDVFAIPFKTYAEHFNLIESDSVSVIVPQDDASIELCRLLENGIPVSTRKLQKYACSIYPNELDDLKRQNVVKDYGFGIWCLTNTDYYDEKIGITFEAKDYFL